MPPENDTIRRKRDLEFQSRVLSALEKPNESPYWALLNQPFTLWLLSLILLTLGGAYFTAYRQCQRDAYAEIEQFRKLQYEVRQRDAHIRKIINDSPTVTVMREKLVEPYYFYPEFKDYPIRAIREAYFKVSQRITNYFTVGDWGTELLRSKFVDVIDGDLPSSVVDDDIAALRKLAQLPLQTSFSGVPLVLLEQAYEPTCHPAVLFKRSILGDPVSVVKQTNF